MNTTIFILATNIMKQNVNNLKHKELYERYNQQPWPKAKRSIFSYRVIRCWYDKIDALNPDSLLKQAKRKQFNCTYDENWRVCTKCWEYKVWSEYAKNKVWVCGFTSKCKDCRNKYHQEYRDKTNRARDKQYKIEKRKLNIWDQVYFNSQIREVAEYKSNRWYKVVSIMTWEERRLSTSDNHNRPNTNCARFVKIKNPIVLMRTTEKPKFTVETDDEFYELY